MPGGGRDAENPLINDLLASAPGGPAPGPPTRAPEGTIPVRKTISAKAGSQAGATVRRRKRKTSVRSAPRTRLL